MLAQGAVQATESGDVLGRALAASHGVEKGLQRYEAARRDRTTRMVPGPAENARRFHIPEWAEARVRERCDWLLRYEVDTVAI